MAGYELSQFIHCDLLDISRFLARGDRDAARKFYIAFYYPLDFLADTPGAGHPRHDLGRPDIRSLAVNGYRRYLIFYRTRGAGILVHRLLHGARDFSRLSFDE